MCIAIYQPAKKEIPISHLHSSWVHNPDGAGFAFANKGKITHVKGLMTYKEFLEAYQVARKKYSNNPFLVHFRIRSAGDRKPDNTHPFMLKNGAALIHNGTIDGTGAKYDEGKSDTALFVEKYGDWLTFENVSKHKSELDLALGYNKIVILYPDKNRVILNEKDGVWDNDIWYSNHTFKPRPSFAPGAACAMVWDED